MMNDEEPVESPASEEPKEDVPDPKKDQEYQAYLAWQQSKKKREADLDFDLELATKPVKLRGNDGRVIEYTLRELDGADRDKFLGMMHQRMVINPQTGVPTSIKSSEGIESRLIHLSLYDKDNVRVPQKVIESWPGQVQRKLFDAAQAISGLDKESEENAKNASKTS